MEQLISNTEFDDETTLEAIKKIPIIKNVEDWVDHCGWAISTVKPKVLGYLISQIDKKTQIDVWDLPYGCAEAIMRFDKSGWTFNYVDIGSGVSILPICAQAYVNGDTEIMNYYVDKAKDFEGPAFICFSILTGIL